MTTANGSKDPGLEVQSRVGGEPILPAAAPCKPLPGPQPAAPHTPSRSLDAAITAASQPSQTSSAITPRQPPQPAAHGPSPSPDSRPAPQPSPPQQRRSPSPSKPLNDSDHGDPERSGDTGNCGDVAAAPPASPVGHAAAATATAASEASRACDQAARAPGPGVSGPGVVSGEENGDCPGGSTARPCCDSVAAGRCDGGSESGGGSPRLPQMPVEEPTAPVAAALEREPALAEDLVRSPKQQHRDQGQPPEPLAPQQQQEQVEQQRQEQADPRPQRICALFSDPDYEIPRGALTETQVLHSLEQKQQQQQQRQNNRPVKLDRYGFVLAGQDDGPDGGDSRRNSGAGATTSGPAPGQPTRIERLLGRELRLPLRQRRRQRRQSAQLDQQQQQYTGRLRKWRKMLGRGGEELEEYRLRRPEKLKRRVRKGIPDPLRGLAWLAVSGGRQLKESNPGLFAALLSLEGDGAPAPLQNDARARGEAGAAVAATPASAAVPYSAPSPDVTLCIMRDLNRTFPSNVYFMQRQGPGQKALFSVLWATAAYTPAVGYVQGMGFLAAVLLLYMEAEEAFWTLQAMLMGPSGWPKEGGMERLYTAGMPGLQCCLYQFRQLLREAVPRLAARMDREGVEPELYGTHWFNTAFAYTLPFPYLLRVWDVFLHEGPKTLFRVGLAVLQYAEGRLLGLRFEALVSALSARNLPALLPPDPGELIARAARIHVSRRLAELRDEWQAAAAAQGQERQRGGGGGGGRGASGRKHRP